MKLTQTDVECLWSELDKSKLSSKLIRSYYIVFVMAARYATLLDAFKSIFKKVKLN